MIMNIYMTVDINDKITVIILYSLSFAFLIFLVWNINALCAQLPVSSVIVYEISQLLI